MAVSSETPRNSARYSSTVVVASSHIQPFTTAWPSGPLNSSFSPL